MDNKNNTKKTESSLHKEFDQNILMDYVKKYSFPRTVGSDGERKVRKMLFKEFNDIGLKAYKEEFVCSLAFSKWLLPVSLIFFLIILVVTQLIKYYFDGYDILMDIFFITGVIFDFTYVFRKGRNPQKFLAGKLYHSANIFSIIPAKNFSIDHNGTFPSYDDIIDGSTDDKTCGNIIISAHSDSKSQIFTTMVRIKIFQYAIIILILLFLGWIIGLIIDIIIGPNEEFKFTTFFSISITITLTILTIFLIMNRSGNDSPGALDNATGIAVVFALAQFFKKHPLENFNLWFMHFGVEEFGQPGAINFVLKRLRRFTPDKTFNFNLDMVGECTDEKLGIFRFQGFRKKPIDPMMWKIIKESAKESEIELLGFNLRTGARTDRKIFTKYGFHGIDFISYNAGKQAHSLNDTIDKVNPLKLKEACIVISLSARKIDAGLENYMSELKIKHSGQGYL